MFRALMVALAVAMGTTACVDHDGHRVPSSILKPDATSCYARPAGSLAFVSERAGQPQIFTVRPGESEPPRQRTYDFGAEFVGAFVGPVGPKSEILVVTSHGHHQSAREQLHLLADGRLSPLGHASRFVRNPSWLPSGGGIVYESDRAGFRDLFLIDVSGGEPEQLTRCEHGCFEPDVSPDGKRIAYASPDSGDGEIYTLDMRSRHSQRLTWSPGTDKQPLWSPSGEHLAFLSNRNGRPRVHVIDHDGSHPRLLRRTAEAGLTAERDHVWSPDGKYIAFVAQGGGSASLCVVRVSTGESVVAAGGASDAWVDQSPSWSPDGAWIAFTSNRDGNPELYLMQNESWTVHRVTTDDAADWLPRWVTTPTGA